MSNEENYMRDLVEIRSMMERSSRFLTLSGWAGISAGLYALAASYVAVAVFDFSPGVAPVTLEERARWFPVLGLAAGTLLLALATAVWFSYRKAQVKGEKVWTATLRRMLEQIAIPLISGGMVLLVFWSRGLIGWIAPLSLVFYGLALYSAGKFTYSEVKWMGLAQLLLGLLACLFVEYGLWFWAAGFGVVHIVYGVYMYTKYDQ